MKDIGKLGEELIARWLQLHSCNLLGQNWRSIWGEIDLIAQNRNEQTIMFVEVKTRSRHNWDENGLLAVNSSKQEKIIKTASLFLAKYPQLADFYCRFDIALINYVQTQQSAKTTNIELLDNIKLGVPVEIAQYQLTIENYLQSAFEAEIDY